MKDIFVIVAFVFGAPFFVLGALWMNARIAFHGGMDAADRFYDKLRG